jgi:hypothetical protein
MVQSEGRIFSGKDVAIHNSRESCWIIVHGAYLTCWIGLLGLRIIELHSSGKVYDVTEFLDGAYHVR